ncbi:MAG: 1-acyl-sn-glycerol-3-phosphate acyltransferase, partial [Clostridia bacterium]|nr:1-acyl-sn-glycerol-3-phosphate acyltransferase [Clostridia bacterium]
MADTEAIVSEPTKKELKKLAKKQKRREKNQKKWEKQYRLHFRANKKGKHISRTMNFLRFMAYPIHRLVYPFKMFGPHKVADGACIYVGNHYCLWDIFYTAHTTREGVHFMAKQSILEAPVLGWWARKVGVIGAMRDGSDVRQLMN